MRRRRRFRRMLFTPAIMLTPGEALFALVALSAGPLGLAALIWYLVRRAEHDRLKMPATPSD